MFIKCVTASLLIIGVAGYEFGKKTGSAGWVEDHNYFRCLHNAPPVMWDQDLADKAQAWVNKLAADGSGLSHSAAYSTWPYSGENLAMGSGTFTCNGVKMPYGQACVTWSWYSEYSEWNCQGKWTDVDFGSIGHFTALVWKGINSIGCASNGKYYACEYGHQDCKTKGVSYGGSQCTSGKPQKLPNYGSCSETGLCVDCYNKSLEATCAAASGSSPTTSPATTKTPGATTTTRVTTDGQSTTVTTSTRKATTTKAATTTKKPTTTTTTKSPDATTTSAPTTTTKGSTSQLPATTTAAPPSTTSTTPLPETTTTSTTKMPTTNWWPRKEKQCPYYKAVRSHWKCNNFKRNSKCDFETERCTGTRRRCDC